MTLDDTQLDEMTQAFKKAIEMVGFDNFKRTSLFMRNNKVSSVVTLAHALELPEIAALVEAGQGVVKRWDSPDWKSGHTLDFITRLRAALSTLETKL